MKTKSCTNCAKNFEITDKDQEFYEKMKVPSPDFCPDCRLQRRLAFRNEVNLYKTKCALTGKNIISIYSPEPAGGGKPYPVYETQAWYGDKWNALEYGRDFNFNRPFFEQFKELWDEVPKLNLITTGENQNSDYANNAYKLTNCYLIFDAAQAFDCLYGESCALIKDCIDFLFLKKSQFCYECINCNDCYNLKFSRFCNNCSESAFLLDCRGCRSCFGCCNLQQKQYHILNEPYSKEEYEAAMESYDLGSRKYLEKIKSDAEEFFKKYPKKALRGMMNENVSGDNISESKDSFDCYDCIGLRDCKYCTNMMLSTEDCHDIDIWGDRLRRAYDSVCVGDGSENLIGCYHSWVGANNIFNSIFCGKSSNDMIGCVGLMHKKYCIFNKQYSKEDYEKLAPKVIEHMRKSGEWGRFFPTELSAFGYNETVAQDFFPMEEEEVLAKGWKWKDPDPKKYQKQTYEVQDRIDEVPDEITDEILACSECGKNYLITPTELKFYRKNNLPIPKKCFHCRHKARKNLRNPRKLFSRNCQKCSARIQTTYAPDCSEIVYCEKCYLEEVK